MGAIKQSDVNVLLVGKLLEEDIKTYGGICKDYALRTASIIDFLTKYNCGDCPCKETSMSVLPQGPVTSPFMIIADVPGEYDILTRTPLFDAGGRLLTLTLAKLGISREYVYITNGVKCNERGNRIVSDNSHYNCWVKHLPQEILTVRPKVVLVLGENNSRVAQSCLLGEDPKANIDLESLRKTRYDVEFGHSKFEMYHTYDPTDVINKVGALYDKYKREFWKDVSHVISRIKELNPDYIWERR